jgi:aminoglycoside phosphotransferase (APT) family kinase protein
VRRSEADVRDAVPLGHRPAVERFLRGPAPTAASTLRFSHNDLGIEHVLVDVSAAPSAATVTGVIDWSDAAVTDPAHDVGLVLRNLGPRACDAAIAAHGGLGPGLPTLRRRAHFSARCSLLEDLAHGLRPGCSAYAEKSLAAMAWLFGDLD